ncbi:MAG: hypothetical protein M8364_21485 [Methylobacter sp.]|uniref:hypothetical protein n=1 Tax=Methylobacter sp. TaxID=2051955 RepID=UPI002582C91A|nr:hypothetical protein [Methylobacter sp.]MCL7423467.1 hypothetical protein [Methylobacter sp.]
MKTVILSLFAASFLVAFVPLYVGIQHNAMGEFCKNDSLDPCSFDYFYALGIWTSWFATIFGSLLGILVVTRLCIVGFKVITNKSSGR